MTRLGTGMILALLSVLSLSCSNPAHNELTTENAQQLAEAWADSQFRNAQVQVLGIVPNEQESTALARKVPLWRG